MNIDYYSSKEGLAIQAEVYFQLSNRKSVCSLDQRYISLVLNGVAKSVKEKLNFTNEELEKVSKGETITFNEKNKKRFVRLLLAYLKYEKNNTQALLKDPSIVRGLQESLIDITNGIITLTTSPDKNGRELHDLLTGDGKIIQALSYEIPIKSNFPLFVIIKSTSELASLFGFKRKLFSHEMWHTFYRMRQNLIESDKNINKPKLPVINLSTFEETYRFLGLINDLVKDELGIRSIVEIEELLTNDIEFELPAIIVDFINNNKKDLLLQKAEEIADVLISCYLFSKKHNERLSIVNFKLLRDLSKLDGEGKYIVDVSKLKLLQNPNSSDTFIKSFFHRVFNFYWLTKQDSKYLENQVQLALEIFLNNEDSPFVILRKNIKKAISAYLERAKQIGEYEAIMEMSQISYARWPAFIRLKKTTGKRT